MKAFRQTTSLRLLAAGLGAALAALGATWLTAAEPSPVPESPQPVVRAYMKAMKAGDIDGALKLTARIEGLSEDKVRSDLAKYSKTLREQNVETIYHESRATQGCALVIVEQRRPKFRTEPSILPVMLVLQDKQWRTLPKLNPELRKTALSADLMEEIRVLGKWFVEQVGPIEERSRKELGKPLKPGRDSLAGVWQTSTGGVMTLLRLKADGSFDRARLENGRPANELNGRWSLNDGQRLVFDATGDVAKDKARLERRVIAVTRNILGLAPINGPREIWRRVPDEAYQKLKSGLKTNQK